MAINDEVLRVIGRVAIYGAAVEFRLGLATAAMLGLPQRIGLFVVGNENASRSIDRLREAVGATDECDAREAVDDWLRRVSASWSERNRVIHSQIAEDGDGGLHWVRLSKKLASGPAFTNEPVDRNELLRLADDLTALSDEFDTSLTAMLIRDLPYTRPALGHTSE